MRSDDFFVLLLEHWLLYALAVLISGGILYLIAHKYIVSLIDPLFFAVLGSVFANAVPIFLLFVHEIKYETFVSFVLLETAFWIGFCLNKRHRSYEERYRYNIDSQRLHSFFFASAFFVIAFQLLYYVRQGIPMFFESRIDKYSGAASGLGIFERFVVIIKTFCILYSFCNFNSKGSLIKKSSRFFVFFILVTSFLTGSKSSLLGLILPFFFYAFYIKKLKINLKIALAFAGGILLLGALMIIVTSTTESMPPYIAIMRRFSMYGDIYYEAYGNEMIREIKINTPFKDLFVPILGPFRIINYADMKDSVPSIQIHNIVYPELAGLLEGPNNRMPVLYYSFWGIGGGVLASFITGYVISCGLFRLRHFFKKTLIGLSVYATLYISLCGCMTDPIYGMEGIASLIFGYVFMIILSVFINKSSSGRDKMNKAYGKV